MPHRYCERWKIYVTFFFFVKIYLLLGEGDKDRLEETKAHEFWKIWFLLPFHGNLVRSYMNSKSLANSSLERIAL